MRVSTPTHLHQQDEEGKESARTVDMMIAKDRERVPLHQPFTMEGAWDDLPVLGLG